MRLKPSARHKMALDTPELNLNSMMDLFAVLIPALLMMSAVLEISILNVSTPALSQAEPAPPPPPKEPLHLTLEITNQGYIVSSTDGVFNGSPGLTFYPRAADPSAPAIKQHITYPLVKKNMSCARYVGNAPPPRMQNKNLPVCKTATEEQSFWSFNQALLTQKMIEIKDAYPDETRLIISADPEIEYEAVIDAMDATRDVRQNNGELRSLFDEVVLRPGRF